jgi:hypothetical protein
VPSQSQSTRARLSAQILPRDFAASWLAQTRSVFLDAFGDTMLLLVQLEDEDSEELIGGLEGASTFSGERLKPTYDAIGFATVMHEVPEVGPASSSTAPRSVRFDPIRLATQIVRKPHFVAPLRRRAMGRAFVEHISVGRARNSDIVLRHSSVSKFHAWFECDDLGKFYVGDAKSKNGTKVNGERIGGQPLTPLDSGDEIRFGKVVTTIVAPPMFWDAMRG